MGHRPLAAADGNLTAEVLSCSRWIGEKSMVVVLASVKGRGRKALRNSKLVALLGSVLEFKAMLVLLLLSQQDLRGLEARRAAFVQQMTCCFAGST